jgi:hypothetical protein
MASEFAPDKTHVPPFGDGSLDDDRESPPSSIPGTVRNRQGVLNTCPGMRCPGPLGPPSGKRSGTVHLARY